MNPAGSTIHAMYELWMQHLSAADRRRVEVMIQVHPPLFEMLIKMIQSKYVLEAQPMYAIENARDIIAMEEEMLTQILGDEQADSSVDSGEEAYA